MSKFTYLRIPTDDWTTLQRALEWLRDNRTLGLTPISPIGVAIDRIVDVSDSVEKVGEYLTSAEVDHYCETDIEQRPGHIYKHVCDLLGEAPCMCGDEGDKS